MTVLWGHLYSSTIFLENEAAGMSSEDVWSSSPGPDQSWGDGRRYTAEREDGMDTQDSEERERCQKEGSRTELEQDVG